MNLSLVLIDILRNNCPSNFLENGKQLHFFSLHCAGYWIVIDIADGWDNLKVLATQMVDEGFGKVPDNILAAFEG